MHGPVCLSLRQNKNKLVKNLESSNCVIASSQNSNSFLERFDRMNPWRRRRNFKPMKLQNSLVGTKAFIKDSLRQCARLVKAFGTKLWKNRILVGKSINSIFTGV